MTGDRIKLIRDSERKSHSLIYTNEKLYHSNGWLKSPIKTVQEIVPLFSRHSSIRVLDLGAGVGRNSIYIADKCRTKNCSIDCIDLLDVAINKLREYAAENNVDHYINGFVKSIEEYQIAPGSYDLILAISALEHVENEACFLDKLSEVKNGIKENGVFCLVANSDIHEFDIKTQKELEPQFEVNLPTNALLTYLKNTFHDWEIIKQKVSNQTYEIPRGTDMSRLSSNVITFVVRRKNPA